MRAAQEINAVEEKQSATGHFNGGDARPDSRSGEWIWILDSRRTGDDRARRAAPRTALGSLRGCDAETIFSIGKCAGEIAERDGYGHGHRSNQTKRRRQYSFNKVHFLNDQSDFRPPITSGQYNLVFIFVELNN